MIDQIRPADLGLWLSAAAAQAPDSAPLPVVLDVREPWERQTASVRPEPGFELVALPMGEVVPRLSELDPARPVACLCHHGARSQRVALYLQQQGFEQVANIAGGIDAWSAERDAAVPRY